MNLQKLENENEEQFIWRLGQAKDSGVIDINWNEIADVINHETNRDDMPYQESAYRKPYQQAKRFYDAGVFAHDSKDKNKKSIEEIQNTYGIKTSIIKDGTCTSDRLLAMSEEESKNPEFVLKAHGYDPDLWKIVSARNTMRQQFVKTDGMISLYASAITVKPIEDNEIPLKKIEEFFDKLDRNYSLPTLKNNDSYLQGDKMLLIDIADLHMNLQASVFTSGNEYNCDIAERLFFYVIEDILTRTQTYNFEEIVFCVGGDMLNGDHLSGSTTKGTPQDSDIHYYDAYERLCAMTIKAIDVLKDRCNKINVIYVAGNHDEVTGFKLAKYVDAWFRNDDMVTVDYDPVARKYKLYGKTLLCFAHDGKVQKLPAIIANEARQHWAQADTVEVFLQHLHTEQVLIEENNIRIQRLPTISARSKWSADNGYGSKRQCKSFVFDREDGMTDVLYTNIKDNIA